MAQAAASDVQVAIVGGGLAGLAAAVALAGRGLRIELFEARRTLGGRATSFRDPATGETLDNCQHVSMACCTNLADFCRRTGIAAAFRRERTLHFLSPAGRRHDLRGSRWLPAPLHLAPSLLKLGYLSWRERLGIGRALVQLMRNVSPADAEQTTAGAWLKRMGQSPAAIERFWSVVIVSALSETVDRASLAAARKVFVDGFLSSSRAYELDVPAAPLGELYGQNLEEWLRRQGVAVHLSAPVTALEGDAGGVRRLLLADGRSLEPETVVLALPWRPAGELLAEMWPDAARFSQLDAAPITGVHLWFDREITPLRHAVVVGRLSQWLFRRDRGATDSKPHAPFDGVYYQVVISASRPLAERPRAEVIQEVRTDLEAVFPDARGAQLLHWRMVTERAAVFSCLPETEHLRPGQRTPIPNLLLAGDWTATGWPSTMEGAVRSGYLAAEGVLAARGQHARILKPDLPRGWLARWLIV